MVILSLELLQEVEGSVAERVVELMSPEGEEHRHNSIDKQEVERSRGEVLLVGFALTSKRVVRPPVRSHRGSQEILHTLDVLTLNELREAQPSLEIEVGKLRDADMREVLRAQSEEAPAVEVDGLEGELMCQIAVFVVQSEEILVGDSHLTMSLWNRQRVEESCLAHEESLYLEDVVAVVADIVEWNAERPLLHGLSVDAKAVVTRHGDEEGSLPGTITASGPPLDILRLPLQALRLQGTHPRMFGEAGERGDDAIARRIAVGLDQLVVVAAHLLRNRQLHLRRTAAVSGLGLGISESHDMEDDVVVMCVLFVTMEKPVAGLVVNLHIAHPQLPTYLHFGVEEVGAGVAVVESGIQHL